MELGAFSISLAVEDLASSREFYETLGFEVTGHTETWDVVETAPGTLFVTANPSSSGPAFLGKLDGANLTAAIRVADEREIRAEPMLIEAVDGSSGGLE